MANYSTTPHQENCSLVDTTSKLVKLKEKENFADVVSELTSSELWSNAVGEGGSQDAEMLKSLPAIISDTW